MYIKNIRIGKNFKTFLIAEVGLSHEGSLGLACSMIDRAKEVGADAVKFQMHIAEEESTIKEKFRSNIFIQDKTRFDYWKRTSFTFDQWSKIKQHCKKKNIIFLCSPFSLKAVDYLKKLDVDAWKIASGEFNNLLLLNKIVQISNKPLILSTGLTYDKEIKKVLSKIGDNEQVKVIKHIKGNNVESYVPKSQLVSSHTGRRTYITNCLLQGIRPHILMKTTGHKKIGTLLKYNRETDSNIFNEYESKILR